MVGFGITSQSAIIMPMNEITIILPSARAIRYEQLLLDEKTLFLPNYLTMGDFINKLCIVKDFKPIDADTRVLLLLRASDFDSFSELQIQRNFFAFTKNSSYIFKFFQELSAEKYDIKNLANNDIYAEYEEHIEILQELYERYEKLCLEEKIFDKIFLPKLYEFNESFASSHESVELHIDGHLTNFEFELLDKLTNFTEVNIIFSTSKFNTKMQDKFSKLGIELEAGFEYEISLNNSKIISKSKIATNANVSCVSFSESLIQVSYVKQKIYEFIKKGYKAESIAVILPDEFFAQNLRLFDKQNNFNFAMGEPYSQTYIYEKLNATLSCVEQNSKENEARLKRVGDEYYEYLKDIYFKNANEVNIIQFLNDYKTCFEDKRVLKVYDEELYKFEKILAHLGEMTIKSVLSMFLQRLASRSLDDVRGGKITVMGVLETRSVSFDGVVIVDFSDSNVPKRSDKDMFLNTQIRSNASLPTMSDRENLQKHYYEMLINSSKEVAISFVKSSESSESRFLKQLSIKENNQYDESEFAKILFDKKVIDEHNEVEIYGTYDFKNKKLSATRLKAFLTCRRNFYYKYIAKLEGHIIPKDIPQEFEIGSAVHKALDELYTKQNHYLDAKVLKSELDKELDKAAGKSELDKYLIALQKKRLEEFAHNEVKWFENNWRVDSCEGTFETEFAGISLYGQIDRVDVKDDEIYVLDYKTGSYPIYNKNSFVDATDFQLEFYYLLTRHLSQNISCGYYDLKENKIVPEAFLEEKLEILKSNIKDLLELEEINFMKCEDAKSCLYCDYKIMCGRD